jgi:predicted GIY-YIG superfamily endonuclease
MAQIYVLRLEYGKYYVGRSSEPRRRYQEHVNGNGSAWTRKYRPLAIEEILPSTSVFDEDKVTKEYMLKHGIENVRGGSYVQEELNDIQIETLKTEIWSAKDACTRCGRAGHFVKDCYARSDISGNSLEMEEVWECEKCYKEFDTYHKCQMHERHCRFSSNNPCSRCGRRGHYSPSCYASTHIKGYPLSQNGSVHIIL